MSRPDLAEIGRALIELAEFEPHAARVLGMVCHELEHPGAIREEIARQVDAELRKPITPEAAAARASFEEDHSLGARSWGKGRHGSIPKTHGATGRNWVD